MTTTNPEMPPLAGRPRALHLPLNARYEVADEATKDELLNDVGLLLDCAFETVNTLAHGLCDEGGDIASNLGPAASVLFGAGYMIRMAAGASEAAFHRDGIRQASTDELLAELERRGQVSGGGARADANGVGQ